VSYTLSPDHLKIDPNPFTHGGFGDVYNGTLSGSEVCVKRLRVYTSEDPKKATEVHCWRGRFPVRRR